MQFLDFLKDLGRDFLLPGVFQHAECNYGVGAEFRPAPGSAPLDGADSALVSKTAQNEQDAPFWHLLSLLDSKRVIIHLLTN